MADYPSTLPPPQKPGYGIAPNAAFRRTNMEAGPARQRQFYTQPTHGYKFVAQYTDAEFDIFQKWYRDNNEGSIWFNITLINGAGVVSHEARFTQPYQANLIGHDLWHVQMNLEVRNVPYTP